jgi:GT2 family glycosyltransferase
MDQVSNRGALGLADVRVLVSIVSHGHEEHLGQLLNDLSQQVAESIHAITVTHNRLPVVPHWNPFVTDHSILFREIYRQSPQGFATNHNEAFERLDRELGLMANDWFLIVNPDIRLSALSLAQLSLLEDDHNGIVAPLVLDACNRQTDAARDLPSPANVLHRRLFGGGGSEDPLWFAGMFLAIRVACWRELKGLDERYYLYCEDVDFCLRARLAGWPIRHERACEVRHDAQRASRRSFRHFFWHVRSLFRLWLSKPYREAKERIKADSG